MFIHFLQQGKPHEMLFEVSKSIYKTDQQK